ncbi:hypothetical protein I4U23_031148 [Adineta vaga]|nr:hypothetical protein I4U23_031148 [Adineta vaga]
MYKPYYHILYSYHICLARGFVVCSIRTATTATTTTPPPPSPSTNPILHHPISKWSANLPSIHREPAPSNNSIEGVQESQFGAPETPPPTSP